MMNIYNVRLLILSAVLLLTVSLAACESAGTKQSTGAKIGAGVGFLLGLTSGGKNKERNALFGALALGFLGSKIGKAMDKNDRSRQNSALETSRTNVSVSWSNPDSGNRFKVTPTKTYKSANRYCREYETEAYIRGEPQVFRGRACRNSKGNWVEEKRNG